MFTKNKKFKPSYLIREGEGATIMMKWILKMQDIIMKKFDLIPEED